MSNQDRTLRRDENPSQPGLTRIGVPAFLILVAGFSLLFPCMILMIDTLDRDIHWPLSARAPFLMVGMLAGGGCLWAGCARIRKRGGGSVAMLLMAGIMAVLGLPFSLWAAFMSLETGGNAVMRMVGRETVVREAASPDGRWRAFVINKPNLEARDHRLMLEEVGKGKAREVARTMRYVDPNAAILWAPGGEMVVWRNRYDLFALRLADMKSAVVLAGKAAGRTDLQGFVIGDIPRRFSEIRFDGKGGLSVETEGKAGKKIRVIPEEAFAQRREEFLINFMVNNNPAEAGPGKPVRLE